MRTQMMVGLIVLTISLIGIGAMAGLILWLGWGLGSLLSIGGTVAVVLGYLMIIKPWHLRWGATDIEVIRPMPGDELVPDTNAATRAISIDANADEIWPWLVQIGYGKAGWYSYDWIDNDFHPSANEILSEHQDLAPGDHILMMPTTGFIVDSVDAPRSIVSMLEDGSTSWCLALYPHDGRGTRLVSRWRPKFEMTLATFFLTVLSEPGTFIMEQKMLRSIRDRVENSAQHLVDEQIEVGIG